MTNLEKLKLAVEETVADDSMTSEEKQQALMTILNNSTRLYMEMLKVNLELKTMPTRKPGVFSKADDSVVM